MASEFVVQKGLIIKNITTGLSETNVLVKGSNNLILSKIISPISGSSGTSGVGGGGGSSGTSGKSGSSGTSGSSSGTSGTSGTSGSSGTSGRFIYNETFFVDSSQLGYGSNFRIDNPFLTVYDALNSFGTSSLTKITIWVFPGIYTESNWIIQASQSVTIKLNGNCVMNCSRIYVDGSLLIVGDDRDIYSYGGTYSGALIYIDDGFISCGANSEYKLALSNLDLINNGSDCIKLEKNGYLSIYNCYLNCPSSTGNNIYMINAGITHLSIRKSFLTSYANGNINASDISIDQQFPWLIEDCRFRTNDYSNIYTSVSAYCYLNIIFSGSTFYQVNVSAFAWNNTISNSYTNAYTVSENVCNNTDFLNASYDNSGFVSQIPIQSVSMIDPDVYRK